MPIAPEKLKIDAIIVLKAGVGRWFEACRKESLSSEIKWLCLCADAMPNAHARDIMSDFYAQFVKTPGWNELADMMREVFQNLADQYREAKRWAVGLDKDLIEGFPAAELIAVIEPPPEGWKQKWEACGGRVIEDRCVARKLDPVWAKFSEFGHPYAPYEWTGSLGAEDIEIDEAEELGL